jgi:RNA polymerase sigma-70 factor (ECF subfamily)
MTLFRFKRGVIPSGEVELCHSNDLLQFRQEPLKLEQKVTGYFEQWREKVYRYVVAAFGNSAQAEDVTQEAFLQLYRCLHAGQSIGNVRAWVFRVAHNLAVNQIKSQQFITPLDDETWAEIRRLYRDTSPTPEQKLLQREKFDRLRIAVTSLTPPERQCLHLRTKGFRYREIANILDMSTTTVAETLYRVIEKLAKENYG